MSFRILGIVAQGKGGLHSADYAVRTYGLSNRRAGLQKRVLGYCRAQSCMLAADPWALATRWHWGCRLRATGGDYGSVAANMVAGGESGVNGSQAINIGFIQIVVAIGPPLRRLIFTVI